MGKLSIITNTPVENKLTINNNNEIYYTGHQGTVSIVEGDLRYRPIHCSELNTKLSNRRIRPYDLFISGIDGENDYRDPIIKFSYIEPEGEIDEIDTTDIESSFPLCGELKKETIEEVDKKYIELFGDNSDATEEINFLLSTNNLADTEIEASIDLIKGFDSYTNTVSLNELINYSTKSGTSGRVSLTVLYSIQDTIRSHNTMFEAFNYDSLQNLQIENMIEDIDGLVQLEYINGVIKVIPISKDVDECIINNCTVIYGRIK